MVIFGGRAAPAVSVNSGCVASEASGFQRCTPVTPQRNVGYAGNRHTKARTERKEAHVDRDQVNCLQAHDHLQSAPLCARHSAEPLHPAGGCPRRGQYQHVAIDKPFRGHSAFSTRAQLQPEQVIAPTG